MLCGCFNEFSNIKTPFYILYKTIGVVCTLFTGFLFLVSCVIATVKF